MQQAEVEAIEQATPSAPMEQGAAAAMKQAGAAAAMKQAGATAAAVMVRGVVLVSAMDQTATAAIE